MRTDLETCNLKHETWSFFHTFCEKHLIIGKSDINLYIEPTGEVKQVFVQILRNKIHRARLTSCDVDYEGSLEIDIAYLEAAGILPYEKILVVNASNGQRLETYAIPGERGKGVFCLNGAAAHRGKPGDIVTIMTFAVMTPEEAGKHEPTVIVLDERNQIVAKRKGRTELPLN